jgi:hypothetical protein
VQDAEEWSKEELTLLDKYMQEILQRVLDENGTLNTQYNPWYIYKIPGSSFHAHKLTFTHEAPGGKTLQDLKRSLERYYGFRNKDGEAV